MNPAALQTPVMDVPYGVAPDLSRQSREQLRAWLVREYHAIDRGLRAFDLDADGALSAAELQRVAEQAGLQTRDVVTVLTNLGVGALGSAKISIIADFIEGNTPATMLAEVVKSASMGSTMNFADVVQEVVRRQSDLRAQLLPLLTVGPGGSGDDVRASILALMATASWKDLYQIEDDFNSSLLLLASRGGMSQVVNVLLDFEGPAAEERKAFADRPNDMYWTPLLLACQSGHVDICEALLRAHADANSTTKGTRLTPLMLAASNGHARVVELLLDSDWSRPWVARADPWRTSIDGRTALDFVRGRLDAGQRLAVDASLGTEGPTLDTYGVRCPAVALEPEQFGNVERALLSATGGSGALGQLRLDLLLSPVEADLPRVAQTHKQATWTGTELPGTFVSQDSVLTMQKLQRVAHSPSSVRHA